MKIELHNKLTDKAKTKNDGVYSCDGNLYLVKNNSFIAYANYIGELYTVHGAFHLNNGKCERWDRKKELLKYLKSLK